MSKHQKLQIRFDRMDAIRQGIQVTAAVSYDENTEQRTEYEQVRIPRMLDIDGNIYYVINRNKRLPSYRLDQRQITLEVIKNGIVYGLLRDWLNSHNIMFYVGGAGGTSYDD